MNSGGSSALGRTSLTLSEAAKESGILEIFIDSNNTLTATIKVPALDQFSQRVTIDSKFHPMVRTLMKDVKSMLKAKGIEDPIINEIGFQIGNTLNQEENYKLFRDLEDRRKEDNSEDQEYKSQYLKVVDDLRKLRLHSDFSFSEWQLTVNRKYNNLKNIVHKNFREAWPLLEFCLAVKSILHIEGCTLPFMGVILAIPSSMKTLVIELFRKYPFSIYSDSFTPNSFESHNAVLSKKELREVDLLPKLPNKIFLTPELAPVFTANEDDLRKLLGIITRILDGDGLETDSGAQGHRRYGKTFFVWIGAAVEIPYRVWQLLGTLGHKIYFFRPVIPEKTIPQLEKVAKENDFQVKFKETEEALLEYLIELDSAPVTSSSRIDENGIVKIKWNENECDEQTQAISCIAQIANLQKRLRGTVYVSQSKSKTTRHDHKYSIIANSNKTDEKNDQENHEPTTIVADDSDYDTDYPIVEDPSRATVMLRNLAIGNAISQGRDYINLEDVSLIINVALSTSTKARSELVRLLLRKGGEVTTSTIVNENRISSPFAKKTMRELAALGIVDISAVASYSNSELRITLTDEYKWFKGEVFQKLFSDNQNSKNSSTENESSNNESNDVPGDTTNKASNKNHHSEGDGDKNENNSEDTIQDDRDSDQSHAERQSTLDAHAKIYDACDSFKNKSPEFDTGTYAKDSLDDNSNQLCTSEIKSDRQTKSPSSDDTKACDNITELKKNNVHVWGSKSFQHATVTASHNHTKDDEIMEFIIESIVYKIRISKGSIVSINEKLREVYDENEIVRSYLGDKLTQRESRKVQKIYLAIIRYGDNIHVVKTKPQIMVQWVDVS